MAKKVAIDEPRRLQSCRDCQLPVYSPMQAAQMQAHGQPCGVAHLVGWRDDPRSHYLCTECWMLRYSRVWIRGEGGAVGQVAYRPYAEECRRLAGERDSGDLRRDEVAAMCRLLSKVPERGDTEPHSWQMVKDVYSEATP